MKRLMPFFSYFGAKWRAAHRYPKPLHSTIVEPFAGAAGYSLNHYRRNVVLSDTSPHIAAVWRYLLNATKRDVLSLPLLEPGESLNDHEQLAPGERALIGFWLSKGVPRPRVTMSRSSWGTSSFWCERIRQRVAEQLEKIRHWRFIDGGYEAHTNAEASWFIDPPYKGVGRCYPNSRHFDHRRLGVWVRSRIGQVIVCAGPDDGWLPFKPLGLIKGTRKRKSIERVFIARQENANAI